MLESVSTAGDVILTGCIVSYVNGLRDYWLLNAQNSLEHEHHLNLLLYFGLGYICEEEGLHYRLGNMVSVHVNGRSIVCAIGI